MSDRAWNSLKPVSAEDEVAEIMRLADLYRNEGNAFNNPQTARSALEAKVNAMAAELAAVRSLMNTYNLGGWTDAVAPMKMALQAEDALATAQKDTEALREMVRALWQYQDPDEWVANFVIEVEAAIATEQTSADPNPANSATVVRPGTE